MTTTKKNSNLPANDLQITQGGDDVLNKLHKSEEELKRVKGELVRTTGKLIEAEQELYILTKSILAEMIKDELETRHKQYLQRVNNNVCLFKNDCAKKPENKS